MISRSIRRMSQNIRNLRTQIFSIAIWSVHKGQYPIRAPRQSTL